MSPRDWTCPCGAWISGRLAACPQCGIVRRTDGRTDGERLLKTLAKKWKVSEAAAARRAIREAAGREGVAAGAPPARRGRGAA